MTTDARTGRGRWREGRPAASGPSPTRTRATKWLGALLLSTLLLTVIGVMGWLSYQFLFPSKPDPLFVPFWIARYQQEQIAPIPGIEAERRAPGRGAVRQDRLHPRHGHELESRGHEDPAGRPASFEGQ